METHYCYIDESGVLSDQDTFSVFALIMTTSNTRTKLGRLMKKIRQRRLHKSLRQLPEIKFNASDDATKKRVLRQLADLPVALYGLSIEKNQRPVTDTPENYATAVAALVDCVEPPSRSLVIIYDKRFTRSQDRALFNEHVTRLVKNHSIVRIEHLTGQECPQLQPVDFVAGMIRQKHVVQNEEFIPIIKTKLRKEIVEKWSDIDNLTKKEKQQNPGG